MQFPITWDIQLQPSHSPIFTATLDDIISNQSLKSLSRCKHAYMYLVHIVFNIHFIPRSPLSCWFVTILSYIRNETCPNENKMRRAVSTIDLSKILAGKKRDNWESHYIVEWIIQPLQRPIKLYKSNYTLFRFHEISGCKCDLGVLRDCVADGWV